MIGASVRSRAMKDPAENPYVQLPCLSFEWIGMRFSSLRIRLGLAVKRAADLAQSMESPVRVSRTRRVSRPNSITDLDSFTKVLLSLLWYVRST